MTARTKSRRIALLFEYPTLNGGERSMLACLDCWQKQSADVEFVAIAPGQGRLVEALTSRGIENIPWTRSVGGEGVSLEESDLAMVRAVQQANPDLLHANSLAMGRVAGRIADRLSVPTSAHLRDIVNLSNAAMVDLNRNRLLVAVSQATRDAHVSRGMDRDRVVVIHNGVDLDEYRPMPRRGWLRQQLGLAESALLAATIGQIGLRKGQDVLAAAAPGIVQHVPDAHFLLIGERSSSKAESLEFERNIEHLFAVNGLSSHLHRLGYRDDVPDLMAEIDLIVHPANQEPFGRVLLEAAACGVPVVATQVGGTAEIVVDGVTGRLVPRRDAFALATGVTELLRHADIRLAMSRGARLRAVNEFNVEQSASRLFKTWCALIGQNG